MTEERVRVPTLGQAFSPGERVPREIPAVLRLPEGDGRFPAVVIVHGSGGVDGRGALHARALAQAGIASLEIDMWTPRGVRGLDTRPKSSLDTLPDAYGALAYLNTHPRIQPGQIGIMGFSWGGVVSMMTAFGVMPTGVAPSPELRFRAHAPFYPLCDVWLPGGRGLRLIERVQGGPKPTGAPVLLHNGTEDDYDPEPDICNRLPAAHPDMSIEVVMVPGATHGFDGERTYPVFFDPVAKGGRGAQVRMVPHPEEGQKARERVVAFFKKHLSGAGEPQASK